MDYSLLLDILQIALIEEKKSIKFQERRETTGMFINDETMRNMYRKISTTGNTGTTKLLANDFLWLPFDGRIKTLSIFLLGSLSDV